MRIWIELQVSAGRNQVSGSKILKNEKQKRSSHPNKLENWDGIYVSVIQSKYQSLIKVQIYFYRGIHNKTLKLMFINSLCRIWRMVLWLRQRYFQKRRGSVSMYKPGGDIPKTYSCDCSGKQFCRFLHHLLFRATWQNRKWSKGWEDFSLNIICLLFSINKMLRVWCCTHAQKQWHYP